MRGGELMRPSPAELRSLCYSLQRPGSSPQGYDKHRRRLKLDPAIERGTPFFIHIAPCYLFLDADRPDAWEALLPLRLSLLQLGCRWAAWTSGRPGHVHLVAVVPDALERATLVAEAKTIADLNVNRSIRPPGVPHPTRPGLGGDLLYPGTWRQVITDLVPCPVIEPAPLPKAPVPSFAQPLTLPPSTVRLLQDGDVDADYIDESGDRRSNSKVIQALVSSFRHAGADLDTCHTLLL